MKLYHNPRCGKSREGLAILQASKLPFEIINYIEIPLSTTKLTEIIKLLGIPPNDLVLKMKPFGMKITEKKICQIQK